MVWLLLLLLLRVVLMVWRIRMVMLLLLLMMVMKKRGAGIVGRGNRRVVLCPSMMFIPVRPKHNGTTSSFGSSWQEWGRLN